MSELKIESASGVLFDLGVSSPQLDVAERGFSYRHDGPLDMRMDRGQTWAAADVVNGYREAELARVLREYGDERFADRIARAIVANRPIETHGRAGRHRARRHPGAGPAPRRPPGQAHVPGHPHRGQPRARDPARRHRRRHRAHGRAVGSPCSSYHSGEDRIVKERFRYHATGGCTCPPGLPCVCDAVQTVRLLRSSAWKPTEAEVEANPRAESARLRAVEKLAVNELGAREHAGPPPARARARRPVDRGSAARPPAAEPRCRRAVWPQRPTRSRRRRRVGRGPRRPASAAERPSDLRAEERRVRRPTPGAEGRAPGRPPAPGRRRDRHRRDLGVRAHARARRLPGQDRPEPDEARPDRAPAAGRRDHATASCGSRWPSSRPRPG